MVGCFFSFFFQQLTAYEIGLGIPAEPLFRSVLLQYLGYDATPFNQILKQNAKREMRLRLGKVTVADVLAAQPVTTNLLKFMRRSEERRVGKECGSGPDEEQITKRERAGEGDRR